MTWTSYRNRGETLRRVIDAADARPDGTLPTLDGLEEAFASDVDLLGALMLRWHTRLAGRIEREILATPYDLPGAVVSAWRLTADEHPGIRAVIDAYRTRSEAGDLVGEDADMLARALHTAARKEHELLALMAGLASGAGPATEAVGARLEQQARTGLVLRPRVEDTGRASLIDRLKAALAA
ncbi:hypothetical protein K8Z61_00305 [Nocardioides sp. TRM66260-LWL]|uniref:hypothetical protein n=1 Tax=Nocardioides sp. TRM66260-LWL TaxID=2874478 RepID=UPI001CC48D50|nr:hypothetical protein [Nocardioides sp. TRM66260-LWL]MBZ5732928.1 hypothetical protein [Nocardioides sp. TRM66260-LWL]